MGPKPSQPQSGELFRPRLDEQLNMKPPLVRLAKLINWAEIERDCRRLLLRTKDDYDGAEPSGNSVAALALLRLS